MSDLTDHFLDKDSNKVLVEITLTGDREESFRAIHDALRKRTEITPGAVITQIYFMGYDIEKIVHQKKIELVEQIQNEVAKLFTELDNLNEKL